MRKRAGNLRQIGIVTRNLEAAMAHWGEVLGVGPFYVHPGLEWEEYRYYGKPSQPPIIKMAMGNSGSLQVEIIQQLNDAPSAFLDFQAAGGEGLQHMSAWPESRGSYDEQYAWALSKGFEVAHEGRMVALDLRYAYFIKDRTNPLGPYFEISDSIHVPLIKALFDELELRNLTWDGEELICTDLMPQ